MRGRPRLLLLPGNMCDHRLWTGVRHALEAAGWPSSVADLTQDATIGGMAQRALGDDDATSIPLGFSMGAIVALEMARRAPERISALALLSVNAGPDLRERAAVRPRQQADVRAGRLTQVVAEELKPNYLASANRGDRALRDLTMAMALDLGIDVFIAQSEALRTRADLRPSLSSIRVPVLLACGDEDVLCPPAWHREWAEAIERSKVETIEGAGHLLPLEQPARVAATLTEWLHSIEGTAWTS